MNVLVTGGAGFIGSHYAIRHCLNHPDDTVVVLDKLTYAGNREYLSSVEDQLTFVEGDIADREAVERIIVDHHIDAIVDFAAETHVDNSIKDAHPFLHTNVMGVQNLIEVCKEHLDVLLVHVSTDEVYGEIHEGESPAVPDSPLRPGNPYSASKAAGDLLLMAAVRTYGIRARITRCTNNYGPHQASEKFLPVVIANALNENPIPVYGQGLQSRDWLYVTDHTDAVETVLEKGTDGAIYHVSADADRPNIEIAKAVLIALDKPESLIEFVDDRPGHDWRYALDSSNTRALGWKPLVTFDEGLAKTIEWYGQHLR